MNNRSVAITFATIVCISCTDAPASENTVLSSPTALASPAGPNSGEPFLSPTSDGVWLSWLEAVDSSYELRAARLRGDAWSLPVTIARSSTFFVNWADFPSIVELPDGKLAAHWLQRSGPGRYAYDVVIAMSSDGGATWSEAIRPHSDGTETEHGFATLFPNSDGSLGAVWLDGRETVAASHDAGNEGHGGGAMTLRYGTVALDGTVMADVLVDGRTCDCCQTDVAVTSSGPVVFYRDRSDAEVRDISVSRYIDGEWSAPAPVHPDGWVIPGCPVNGPSAAAEGANVVVAWFTAAQDTARLRVAFSADAGASFDSPHRIDDGDPVGRADVLLLDAETAVVAWLERSATGAEVRARVIGRDGPLGPSTVVAASSAERASGFPRMARDGGRIVFAWTEPGETPMVRTAELKLPAADH